MVLSGKEIENQYRKGNIFISEFSKERLNPNSYNLRLHDELMIYDELYLDMKRELRTQTIQIPEGGYILQPGKLYLGRTEEYTQTDGFVPMLEGRSSVGRLGIYIHVTAGFGDV